MFKLTKILNGKSHAEPIRAKTKSSVNYKFGTLLKMSGGVLANCTPADFPEYLCGESADAGTKDSILVYPINEDMIFRAVVTGSPSALSVGDRVQLSVSGGQARDLTATTEDGVATIIDLENAESEGDEILVRFIEIPKETY